MLMFTSEVMEIVELMVDCGAGSMDPGEDRR